MAESKKDWNPDVPGEVPIVNENLFHSLTPGGGEGGEGGVSFSPRNK